MLWSTSGQMTVPENLSCALHVLLPLEIKSVIKYRYLSSMCFKFNLSQRYIHRFVVRFPHLYFRPYLCETCLLQDVSYVLSSVFGDLYSQDVLQDDTIINLETSRTHDPDFHDYYVQLLNEVGTVLFSIKTDLY